jgi:hypothetical protein
VKRIVLLTALLSLAAAPASRVLDDFENISGWTAAPSDGVSLSLSQTEGFQGKALRLDFDFHGGAGYAVARKDIPIELPENWELSFRVRADSPVNNFEVKLVDPSGDNVWWVNKRGYEFPREWTRFRIKKRHLEFAWGPAGGGELRRAAALEFAVTAGTGGKGFVLIDELTLTELPPDRPYDRTPKVTTAPGGITLDFLENREYGGLAVDWGSGPHASRYEVQISEDGSTWTTVHAVEGGNGGRDYVFLPETESRHLRLRFLEGSGVPEIDVKPLAFSASPNAFFTEIARDAPRGQYPRGFAEQVYWTIVGVNGDREEGLFDEDGRLEAGKGGFSVEPFLWMGGRLVTWRNVKSTPSLRDGYLPILSVTWESDDLSLEITTFAAGTPGASTLQARYRLRNRGSAEARPRLYLAMRPFQVNPPSQFLNTPGGVAPIREIAWDGNAVTVDAKKVVPLTAPTGFGAATFDQGEISEHLVRGRLPERAQVADSLGWASAALAWDLRLGPGESKEIAVAVPLHDDFSGDDLDQVARGWKEELDRVEIRLPSDAGRLIPTLKTTLAYILINRDGPAIQPGSRSYERSWIRDGALTSTVLLRLGHEKEVREFIEWFAPYQFPSGKVPCCVDARGADPVPENDSHGELIHLITEYVRFTGDRDFAARMWPHVEKAVAYMDSLRQQRRTPEYRTPEKRPYFGLLTESISHEGYSDRPVHSYWDDFLALRGLKDAAFLARALGREDAAPYAAMRDEFQADLHASLRRTIALHKIGYIPGSVEKGDYDPTSTSIGIAPGGEMERLPRTELLHTFERYWEESLARKEGRRDWEGYTPYELRNVRTFLRLGWTERAHELLDFFLGDRRPAAWNQWAEVVRRDPRSTGFLGDMPHTWVGSDFLHSVLDFFAYVRESDEALVLGAGLRPEWVEGEGLALRGLRTEYGPLSYTAKREGEGVRFRIEQGLTMPPGGIVVRWQGKEAAVRELPAEVVVRR